MTNSQSAAAVAAATIGACPATACGNSLSYSLGGGGGSSCSPSNFYSNSSHGMPGSSSGYCNLGVDRLGHFSGNNFATDPYSQAARWPPACSVTPHYLPGPLGGSTSPLPPPPHSFTNSHGPMLPFAAQAASANSLAAAVPGGALGDADIKTESAAKNHTAESSEKTQKERPPAPIKPSIQTKVKQTSAKGCCGL